jgi:drug/metabolite transporter (DMT)-like permease
MKCCTMPARPTLALLLLAVLIQAAGNAFISLGMKAIGAAAQGPADWISLAEMGFTSAWIWLGIVCLLGFMILFVIVLSWADLSYAMPIVSIEVVANVAVAAIFLDEEVSLTRWCGVALVALGVALVAGSAKRIRPERAP